MKKYVICLMTIILAIFFNSSTIDSQGLLVKQYLFDMNKEDYQIKNYETLHDFNDNVYYLYNFKPCGYAIFEGQSMSFIEGSFTTNSIYNNYNEEKFYLGPQNYFIKKNQSYYHLTNNCIYERSSLQPLSNEFHLLITSKNSNNNKQAYFDLKDDYIQKNNTIYIKNYQYFKNLYDFPNNVEGSCGFVALSMILGYLDTFYDDNILADHFTYQSNPKYSRGTVDELQYFLMDYGDYVSIPFTQIAKAATARNLYNTFFKYRVDYIPAASRKNSFVVYHEGPLIGNSIPLDEIKFFINKGKPVILIMRSYTYQETENGSDIKNSWHDVIAYGYSNDKFITHFGWQIDGATEYILNSAIIQSYIVIDYFN